MSDGKNDEKETMRQEPDTDSISEWPDRHINDLLDEQPQGFHLHQILFNESGQVANLKPIPLDNKK